MAKKAKVAKKASGAKKAARAGKRPWTEKDMERLRLGCSKKQPAGKIAEVLKRSVGATRQKAFTLGLSLSTR